MNPLFVFNFFKNKLNILVSQFKQLLNGFNFFLHNFLCYLFFSFPLKPQAQLLQPLLTFSLAKRLIIYFTNKFTFFSLHTFLYSRLLSYNKGFKFYISTPIVYILNLLGQNFLNSTVFFKTTGKLKALHIVRNGILVLGLIQNLWHIFFYKSRSAYVFYEFFLEEVGLFNHLHEAVVKSVLKVNKFF